ncbi:MAG: ATP synthase subunit I [Syntrophobacterales bacterium]|nr:MAG: ATP synthase subunit I [Syntrophobacterales bacterium]
MRLRKRIKSVGDMKRTILQKNIEIGNWVALGVILALSFLFLSGRFALGVLLGGLISIVNFYWLSRDLKGTLLRHADRAKPFMMVKFYIRFIVTGVVLFVVITRAPIDIFGLVLGLSVVVINVIVTVVGSNLKNPLRRFRKKNASLFIAR